MPTPKFLLFLLAIVATDAWGHGRVSTVVAADVGEETVVVTIHASLVDLMVIGDLPYEAVEGVSPEDRTTLLRPHLQTMAERFRLIDEHGATLEPDAVRIEIPDLSEMEFHTPGLDQQQMTVVMDYALPSPPASLMFWQSFGEGRDSDMYPTGHYHASVDHHDSLDGRSVIPVYVALTIRQKGELVLLPCELGPGFPVRFPFSWESEVIPLAHRSSLRSAACRWENRPANARLRVDEERVTWQIHFTLEALAEGLGDRFPEAGDPSGGTDWQGLRDFLAERVVLSVDGLRGDSDLLEMTVHPMSAMAVLHGRTLPAGSDQPGIVVFEISRAITETPREIEVGWTFFPDSIARVYSEVLHSGESVAFSVLSAESPEMRWSPGP